MHNGLGQFSHRRVGETILSLLCCVLASVPALGAPYPREGKATEFVQPGGVRLSLRVFGDEFYARTETKDGYTVVFNPADKTYYYAQLGADGESLVPSKVAADKAPPSGLQKHLEESNKVVAAKRAKNVERDAPDRAADWAARKKAVQEARAREAEAKTTSKNTPSPSVSPSKDPQSSTKKP